MPPARPCSDAHPMDWGGRGQHIYPNPGPRGERGEGKAEVLPQHLAARDTLPCSCRAPFGPAGTLLVPRRDLWLQVPGRSCPEVAGHAGQGGREPPAQQGRERRSRDPQSPLLGMGERRWRGLQSGD